LLPVFSLLPPSLFSSPLKTVSSHLMPPRQAKRTRASAPALPPATVENLPQTTRVQRSGRSGHAPPGGEYFDLANISGNEEDEDEESQLSAQAAAQPPIGTDSTIPEINSGINNPDIVATSGSRNQAEDVAYFYDKFPTGYVCKFCKYVFPHY